ncbi:hypothetical protein MAR_010326 [Mya arenaria]|uniref:Uncharacterized protein n=1 Tax=Mya arenaria TaxID=6604 RepID=A0ABY7E1A1_MYAAR|nr:hypothetical protein MAR_010326 [Mya arenaria]
MAGKVPILFHKEEGQGTDTVTYQMLATMEAQDPTADMDLIWKTSILFASPRPTWSGMMQFVMHGNHPGKSSFIFLPMIDMNPSDATCIFSTLKFVSEHARRHHVKPIITFDQPLWWKALMIICAEPERSDLKNIVLRLGGFHTEMSFLGAIGHLIAGSGLQEVMEHIYATNAVGHMMTGKAISRAVRAHLLVDGVLNAMIASDALDVLMSSLSLEARRCGSPSASEETEDVDLPQQPEGPEDSDSQEIIDVHITSDEDTLARDLMGNHDIDEVALLYAHVMDGSLPAEEACRADVLLRIKELLRNRTDFLKSSSRTAAL